MSPSRLQRSSPVNAGSNIGKSRIDRVQRNLKLGGNTDKEVRPELIVYQLGAFCRTGNGRFAFCGHVRKDQEKVEAIVNEAIRKKTDVILEVMPLRKAHAKNTGELVSFKIRKEEASSAGVRRIKAVLNEQ